MLKVDAAIQSDKVCTEHQRC